MITANLTASSLYIIIPALATAIVIGTILNILERYYKGKKRCRIDILITSRKYSEALDLGIKTKTKYNTSTKTRKK
jgi:hypothetical protein